MTTGKNSENKKDSPKNSKAMTDLTFIKKLVEKIKKSKKS
jgi:hypothetical protein